MGKVLDVLLRCNTEKEMYIGILMYQTCCPKVWFDNLKFGIVEKYDDRFSKKQVRWVSKILEYVSQDLLMKGI